MQGSSCIGSAGPVVAPQARVLRGGQYGQLQRADLKDDRAMPVELPELSFADIRKEFDESLGYLKNDISALCRQHETVNYTVALLIACACELMGKASGRQSHEIFAVLLPANDGKALAKPRTRHSATVWHTSSTRNTRTSTGRLFRCTFAGYRSMRWRFVGPRESPAQSWAREFSANYCASESTNSVRTCSATPRHGKA
jgi:hypothetical protein